LNQALPWWLLPHSQELAGVLAGGWVAVSNVAVGIIHMLS
jgi:hypothetical protein